MPYTEALLRSIPRLTDPSHTRLRAIPGRPPDLAALPVGCPFAPRCPYAQDRCRAEDPPARTAGAGHRFSCWFPVGSPEGEDALARNVAAGVPAALAFTGAVPGAPIKVSTAGPTVVASSGSFAPPSSEFSRVSEGAAGPPVGTAMAPPEPPVGAGAETGDPESDD
jgi:oligopeptide/dipeptide ABC transporter ATP-binding protein